MSDAKGVLFIHGMWLHADSWQPWADLFGAHGYAVSAPGWPGEPKTVADARRADQAGAGLGIGAVVEHYAAAAAQFVDPPVLIGHSLGGLVAQNLLSRGIGSAGVAISPAAMRGVKKLPLAQLRAGLPVLRRRSNRERTVSLTAKQFRFGFGNAITADESAELYERHAVPAPGRPLFELAAANRDEQSPAAVDTTRDDRGPLLLIAGQQDHTVPAVVTRAALKQYGDSRAHTDCKQFADRGHSLTIDHGWVDVADYALGWLDRL